MIVNIIGAGNLGKTLGFLMTKLTNIRIVGVCNTSQKSADLAIQLIGQGKGYSHISDLPPADLTFITTPDDSISHVCLELAASPLLQPQSVIVHCSGCLSTEALTAVAKKGCFTASIHPMRSFTHPIQDINCLDKIYCAMEGDPKALIILERLFTTLGAIPYPVQPDKKPLYHAAGVFAANYLVTLAETALRCLYDAGVETELAMGIIIDLMKSSLTNLEKSHCSTKALSGPIQRGDVKTIEQQMKSLVDKDKQRLYALLGKATLQLTNHDTAKKEQLLRALNTD